MADKLLGRIGDFLQNRSPWYKLPTLLAMARLVEIRNQLRRENLHDTEEPPLQKKPPPANLDPALRAERTVDGSYNDLAYPDMGSCGRRFGRNVPLEHTFPDTANLMTPSPRLVSRELMTRTEFRRATILNLLAAAWIQFMVHDWFVHKRSKTEFAEIPLAQGDDWSDGAMKVPRTQQLVGRAGHAAHAVHVRAQPHLRHARSGTSRLERRAAPCKAKLINAALMAKIHTVEWTPAILPHPVIQLAMRTNWFGVKDEELQQVFTFLNESEILGGIIGSKADHHAAPYSLTESSSPCTGCTR